MSIHKLIGVAIFMTATIGWSQTSPQEHAAHHPTDNSSASAAAPAVDPHAGMARIRELIDKAEHARTAAERERLLAEHLAAMRRQLEGLESPQCPMEDRKGMMGGAMAGDHQMMGDHKMLCHAMMKARMETMAELLAQTWRREELRRK